MIDNMVHALLRLLPAPLRRRASFWWRYRRGRVPWDTNETPPEVKAFVDAQPPGRALDLGCGTGTNVLYLAAHGWEVVGVDFIEQAIAQARAKAQRRGASVRFFQGDVTRLDELPITGPFDFLLDIGCLHGLTPKGRTRYAAHLARLARPGARYMLYAGLPREHATGTIGIAPDDIAALFAPHFVVERQERGEDSGAGWPRGWYWLRRDEEGV